MDLFDAFANSHSAAPSGPRSRAAQQAASALTVSWEGTDAFSDREQNPETLLEGLNQQQAEAVAYQGGPLLIMAGAGSGKTRVLTHRIAYLLATGRATAGQILAITFTNKAAAEMRERVGALVGPQARRMWVSTFHSACVRILREQYRAAGLKSTFSIYDQQDSQRLLGMILRAHDVDTKRFTPRLISARISDLKNELITPSQYFEQVPSDPVSEVVADAYAEYQKRLTQANAVDFDDIIMRTVQTLQAHPDVTEYYQRRFRHILVDEYQDTNHAQYVLVRTLVGVDRSALPPAELTVVGDSDQSIYAFRGASIRNIEEFELDFPNAHTILLEQNYRSTQNILSAANAVIKHNGGRRPKNLWTAQGAGDPIVVDAADSEHDEARLVVREIDDLGAKGVDMGDIAVFYRTNSQSRALEELLLRMGIPYRIVGGTRFYERQEIKDALAYLQAITNPDDTVALRRIINTPRRGVGARAEAALMAHADRYGISLGEALADAREGADRPIEGLAPRAAKSVAEFWAMMQDLRALARADEPAAHILDEVLTRSGYLESLRASEDPQDASRVDNLAELLSVAEDFDTTRREAPPEEGEQLGSLDAFLERVALVADADQVPSEGKRGGEVTLMTVHTAKGLEFPYVFVTGMEDGTFPHRRSLEDPAELAEERRLAYVAITRARQRLYLTRAATRSAWGLPEEMPPSRFLDNLPEENIERRHQTTRERLASRPGGSDGGRVFGAGAPGSLKRTFVRQSAPSSAPTRRLGGRLGESEDKPVLQLKVGDRVQHGTLGEGVVIGMEGSGKTSVARIDFGSTTKRLLLRMAPLKKL
ncbi:DNA helicase PcrA [Actinomyces sp. F1_1611]